MAVSVIEDAKYACDLNDHASHVHNCYEIIFLRTGRLELTVGSRRYDAVAPALIFLSKLEQHSIKVISEAYERYYLCISPLMAGSLIRDYTLLTVLSMRPEDFCHVLDASPFAQDAERIFASCVKEHDADRPYADQAQAALLSELLILIYRQKPTLFSDENNKSISVIWKLQCRLEQQCREKYSLTDLAAEYHMSPYYLSHLFKKVTGYSLTQYLTMCRLALARQLLAETDLPITEIVYSAGFSDCSNFSRLFKREMNISPVAYRRQQRN